MSKLRDEVLDVETADKHMHPFDDRKDNPVHCIACGAEIDLGERFVWRPEGGRIVAVCHDHCAVKDGYRLSWAS